MPMSPAGRRATGSYYTPPDAAHAMAHWALRGSSDRLLEPSFGDGVFLRAARDVAAARGLDGVRVSGVELSAEAYGDAVAGGLVPAVDALLDDFLSVQPFPVDAVLGNPPYVRLRHLPVPQRDTALVAAQRVLRTEMEPSGSVWMPFVLHASRFLTAGGRLALVLPYELTHVRYARPLWEHLAKSFGSVRVCRIYERLFPDILQDVVILFADEYGAGTTEVVFELYERVDDFDRGRVGHRAAVLVDDILSGDKPFARAMLPESTREVLRELEIRATVPMSEVCAFNIGYVCGDKQFFHPDAATRRRYRLEDARLVPSLTSARALRGAGLRTSGVASPDTLLLLADGETPTPGEAEYLRAGEESGVNKRFKCRIREPWYAVPGVKTPDLLLSVFSSFPTLVVNDARLVASNSLLCGYLRGSVTAESFAMSWYTPLTVLETELKVHSLGGGVLILIPGEVNAIRLLRPARPKARVLDGIDKRLRSGSPVEAYLAGWPGSGLTAAAVDALNAGSAVLRRWRVRAAPGTSPGAAPGTSAG